MKTECTPKQLELQGFEKRKIIVTNDGEVSTSDGGLILLQQMEKEFQIINKLMKCFDDRRNPNKIDHTVGQLLTQRIFGLCLGYEDLNDHDQWRKDPLLSIICSKDSGAPLLGKSTLNRLELGKKTEEDRYKKIQWDDEKRDITGSCGWRKRAYRY